jgi:ZIP family zinc transporter
MAAERLGLDPLLVLLGLLTGLSTMAGGVLALWLGRRRAWLAGLSSGAVIAVASLDLAPEAFRLSQGLTPLWAAPAMTALAFGVFGLVDRLGGRIGPMRGLGPHLGPFSLMLHSVLDGLGIGLAFAISPKAGMLVAAAILAHDLADGSNTVAVSLVGKLGRRAAVLWLVADAAAPFLGLMLSRRLHVDQTTLALAIAAVAGVFLFIGAAKLAPASRAAGEGGARYLPIALGALGMAAIVLLGAK